MIEISPYVGEADEQRGLDVYNAVWPEEQIGPLEARSYRAGQLENIDLLARLDGAVGGHAIGSIQPGWPDFVAAFVSVLRGYRRSSSRPKASRSSRGPSVPELARGMYEVVLEAAPDIPGAEGELVESFEDWLAHDMKGPGDRPEATFVAVAGDQVIGYAKFSLSAAQLTTAHHDLTGVKRAWRGRGVARALKATQISWAKANGYQELRTRNDERNAPIRHLNEEFGYRPTAGRIYLKGPLA